MGFDEADGLVVDDWLCGSCVLEEIEFGLYSLFIYNYFLRSCHLGIGCDIQFNSYMVDVLLTCAARRTWNKVAYILHRTLLRFMIRGSNSTITCISLHNEDGSSLFKLAIFGRENEYARVSVSSSHMGILLLGGHSR
ncbi:hypothetical protein Droror1_Dr00008045 [Drosera rotundifolia]